MAVHAHPDDESSKGAASTARYVAEGVSVMVVTCTGGERGDVLNPKLADDPRDRRQPGRGSAPGDGPGAERSSASSRSGSGSSTPGTSRTTGSKIATSCRTAASRGYPLVDAARPLVALMRSFRPHVVTTYDENGGYPHPDHIMCHDVSVAAFEAAADESAYPERG